MERLANRTRQMALDYERAVLDAIHVAEEGRVDAQLPACMMFAVALTRMYTLPTPEVDEAVRFLDERGQIPEGARPALSRWLHGMMTLAISPARGSA